VNANTVKHTLRQLLAAVHRDLPGAVFSAGLLKRAIRLSA
jgi:hypothetical protein